MPREKDNKEEYAREKRVSRSFCFARMNLIRSAFIPRFRSSAIILNRAANGSAKTRATIARSSDFEYL
jgi:hypothetical protein